MKIPSKLNVLGQEVTVTFKDDAEIEGNCGLSKSFSNSIDINNSLKSDKIGHTFIHELLHQIDDMCQLDIKHKKIDVLAMALYQVFKDNDIEFK